MGQTNLADLDELVVRCRTDSAKGLIGEAVASFRAGAYRAAIVSTWTAVTYDYISKLRELEIAGVAEAQTILDAFESARAAGDVQKSLRLESEVIETAATKFELLTPIERGDLERLKADRNRCAHPSLQALEEPYSPTAELVRLHIRNAVEHMLGRPPLQGREAWGRIWADVSSQYFPDDNKAASDRLRVRNLSTRLRQWV